MISVCILSKNSSATIAQTLESIRGFPEVLILDNGSTDNTREIALGYPNVKIIEAPFIGFGPMRNKIAAMAANDWILALDSDETITPELLQEIHATELKRKTAYSMARDNYYNGKHIKGCGWSPDRVVRLYNRQDTHYSSALVHESVLTHPLIVHPLKAPMKHVPFRTTAEFLAKMQNYTTLYAEQENKKSSVGKAIAHSLFAFIRSYFFKRGFLLGKEGFIISLYNSNSVFYKYLKLWEKNNRENL